MNHTRDTSLFEVASHTVTAMLTALSGGSHQGSVKSVIDSVVRHWSIIIELDYENETSKYRDHLRGLLAAAVPFPPLGQLFNLIHNALGSQFDLSAALANIEKRARARVGDCIGDWGGSNAKARFKEMSALPVQVKPLYQAAPTRPEFERGRRKRLNLLVGQATESTIWDCLALEFSFFHEHLSHHFPRWQQDEQMLSEGYLLAVELVWLEGACEPYEHEILHHYRSINPDMASDSFEQGLWLIKRCPRDQSCFAKFMLEWAASWNSIDQEVSKDLESQLTGIFWRSRPRKDGRGAKDESLRKLVEMAFCPHCRTKVWDFGAIKDTLKAALDRYLPA